MNRNELLIDIKALHISGNSEAMQRLLLTWQPADIAEILSDLLHEDSFSLEDVADLLLLMPLSTRARIFGYLPLNEQGRLSHILPPLDAAQLIQEMPHDERADLFNLMSEDLQKTLLNSMEAVEREDMQQLASYEEGTAGSIMTSDFATLEAHLNASDAIIQLRKTGRDKETIYQAYVIDSSKKLLGTLSLRDLIMAEPETPISDFMTREMISIRADESREIAAQAISKYDLIALPVLDNADRLVGIVTYDDAMDVASEAADVDFRKVGAVGEIVGGLKDASIRLLYKKRVFWLVLLVFGNIFSGAGIAYFEETIEAYIALVFFLPLLVDSGGNAGSQSATLMVRALATGEVMMKDWAGMLVRELIVAGLLGATMAAAVSLLGIWRGGMEIALVVAITMQVVVVVGSVIGMSLPFLLSKLKFDPATASAPLITSIADACGVIIYFGVATFILDIPSALA